MRVVAPRYGSQFGCILGHFGGVSVPLFCAPVPTQSRAKWPDPTRSNVSPKVYRCQIFPVFVMVNLYYARYFICMAP